MPQYQGKLALLGACMLLAGSAQAAVTVHFVHPEQFSDLPHAPYQREQALDDFAEHFRRLGEEGLRRARTWSSTCSTSTWPGARSRAASAATRSA